MSWETVNGILETVQYVLDMDECDSGDDEVIYKLLECCELSMPAPKRKRRKKWVDERRTLHHNSNASFLTKELDASEDSYMKYLSMTKEQFNKILSLIKNDIQKTNTVMRIAVSPFENLAATLRYIVTGDALKSVSCETGLSQPFLSVEIPKVCSAILKNFKNSYLKSPTTKAEWETIAENFSMKWQFPHCLGAIDGKHILFRPPRKEDGCFFSYKGTLSMILLAVVDANGRFVYVDVGGKGQENDAGVFLESKFKRLINNPNMNFPPDKSVGNGRMLPYVMVGHDAFLLQKHILNSYPLETTDKHQKIFNIRLSRARHVVDNAFEILTNRFFILQNKINLPASKVELITKTCCVLHNFLMDDKNPPIASASSVSTTLNSVIYTENRTNTENETAESVRQTFKEFFNEEGKVDWQDSKL